MLPNEMTIHALLAAAAAKEQGFHATSDAFLALVRQEMNEARETRTFSDVLEGVRRQKMIDVSTLLAWAGG